MAQRRSAERMDDASSLVSRVCEELIRAIQEPLSPPELAELVCGLDRSAAGLGLSIPGAPRIPESARTKAPQHPLEQYQGPRWFEMIREYCNRPESKAQARRHFD